MGTIEHIHIASEASKPMVPLLEAEVIAGRGIEGDRYASKTGTYSQNPTPGRHVTLIEAEVIDDVAQRLGIPLSPHETRRNVTTRGIELDLLIGQHIQVGAVVLEVIRFCDPCLYLQNLLGRPVLQPLVDRAGVRCDVVRGGTIHVGDAVTPATSF